MTVRRVATLAHDDAMYIQMCAIFVRSGHEPQASNVASSKLLPLGNAHTSMAFLSLTRNSGSTAYTLINKKHLPDLAQGGEEKESIIQLFTKYYYYLAT